MKKIIIVIFLLLTLLAGASFPCSANENLNNSYRPPKNSREELYQDIFYSLLIPYIQKSVDRYYSEFLTDLPTVDPWDIDILSVERPNGYRTFFFAIKIEVMPYVGPHISVGVDRLTITVGGAGNVEVKEFKHIENSILPPHYQNIIKKKLSYSKVVPAA